MHSAFWIPVLYCTLYPDQSPLSARAVPLVHVRTRSIHSTYCTFVTCLTNVLLYSMKYRTVATTPVVPLMVHVPLSRERYVYHYSTIATVPYGTTITCKIYIQYTLTLCRMDHSSAGAYWKIHVNLLPGTVHLASADMWQVTYSTTTSSMNSIVRDFLCK